MLSPRTVGTHLYNIKQKLNANNSAEIALIAIRCGLLEHNYFFDAYTPLIIINNIPKVVCESINSSNQTTPIIVAKIMVR